MNKMQNNYENKIKRYIATIKKTKVIDWKKHLKMLNLAYEIKSDLSSFLAAVAIMGYVK